MIFVPLADRLAGRGATAVETWRTAVERAEALDRSGGAWMFHGTSMDSALDILEEGFRCPVGVLSDERNHVYWGSLETALGFADRRAMLAPPALFAARLDDVLASGTPLPMTCEDRQMHGCTQDDELPDWRASMAESGSLRIRGGRFVADLILLGRETTR
jgi:hypothetical protein